jgi:hypothetical protein
MTFNENLANSKHMLKDQLSRKLKKHKQGVWDSIRDSLFSGNFFKAGLYYSNQRPI